MIRKPTSDKAISTRKPNLREAILAAAEELFARNGFNAVSVRDIALAAGANPGSVTYHFKTKDGLLLEIYNRHCEPMNRRRPELLAAARKAICRTGSGDRAHVLPAFSSGAISPVAARGLPAARGDVGRGQRSGAKNHRADF